MIKANYEKRNALYGPTVVEALNKRFFDAYYAPTKEDALAKALELIPEDSVVGWGGSVSIEEIGLKDALRARNQKVMDRDTAADAAGRAEIMKNILSQADTFIMSSNAITEDGQLLNVDGSGNRVAALCYGPKNVVVVAGINKVVRDLEAAENRIKTMAAPINMTRFGLNTPCGLTGKCGDCLSPDCICGQWVRTRVCKPAGRIKVIIVGEDLGF